MSFFDQFLYDSRNYKLYNEYSSYSKVNLSKKVIYEGELSIKSSNSRFKAKYFKIQDRKLLMFSVTISKKKILILI